MGLDDIIIKFVLKIIDLVCFVSPLLIPYLWVEASFAHSDWTLFLMPQFSFIPFMLTELISYVFTDYDWEREIQRTATDSWVAVGNTIKRTLISIPLIFAAEAVIVLFKHGFGSIAAAMGYLFEWFKTSAALLIVLAVLGIFYGAGFGGTGTTNKKKTSNTTNSNATEKSGYSVSQLPYYITDGSGERWRKISSNGSFCTYENESGSSTFDVHDSDIYEMSGTSVVINGSYYTL